MWWLFKHRQQRVINPCITISSVLEEPVSDTLIKIVKNKNKWLIIIEGLTMEFSGSICTLTEYVIKKLDKTTIYSISNNIGIKTRTLSHNELNNILLDWLNIVGSIKTIHVTPSS